jgi:membrane-bound lytic murein transglycosylase D
MRINLLKPKPKPVPSLKRKAAKMGGLLLGVNLAIILATAEMGDSSLHPANLLGTSNESTLEVKPLAPNKDLILSDYKNLIGEDFHIPEGLKDRVGFWFDVYTKYDNNNRIIHHSLYPWIVFKVVDVTEIINADEPRVLWLRNVKADKLVASEMASFRKALTHLSRGKAVDTANEYHVAVEKSLSSLPGSLKENARKALREVRVQTGQRNFFAEGLEVSPLYLKGME